MPGDAAARDGTEAERLLERAMQTGDGAALQRSVSLFRRAIDRSPTNAPMRAVCLSNLAVALQLMFQRTGNPRNLDEAIQAGREAVQASTSTGHDPAGSMSNLCDFLRTRFEVTGASADLTEAIKLGRAAVTASEGDPERFYYLSSLAGALSARFDMAGDLSDANEAIGLIEAAVQIVPNGRLERQSYLSNLCTALRARFRRTGELSDINRAVEAGRASVRGVPEVHPERPRELANLGMALKNRYERLGEPDDITEAIEALQEAVRLTREGNSSRAGYLSDLGNALRWRFERTGDYGDGTRAVEAQRAAVAATRIGHPRRPGYLSNLASALQAQFHQKGELADLNEAVEVLRAAVAATPADHSDRAMLLSNLGDSLRTRFALAHNPADGAEAISVLNAAVRAAPADHPDRAKILYNLALAEWQRFAYGERLRSTPADQQAYLNAAIDTARRAEMALPPDNLDRARILAHLCFALRVRSNRTGNAADLTEAIKHGRTAVQAVASSNPERAGYLSSLATALQIQAERAKDLAGLAESIEFGRAAVRAAGPSQPERAGYLSDLGTALQTRFEWTQDARALQEALAVWREAAAFNSRSADERLTAAVLWARLAAEHGVTGEAEAGFAAAIQTLPLVAWHGLDERTRLDTLSRWAGLAGDAAAWAINVGHLEQAVSVLEQGRVVLWSQVLNLRTDLEHLNRQHPRLARRLGAVRTTLDQRDDPYARELTAGTTVGGPVGSRGEDTTANGRDERMRCADEWDRLVAQVRTLPGFGSFLMPAPFAELSRGYGDGTAVLINISHYRCDALAVTSTGVRLIPLPSVDAATIANQAQRFMRALNPPVAADLPADQYREQTAKVNAIIDEVLAWLWDAVAAPVLDALLYTTSRTGDVRSWPRVWWCPTGALSVLPLHAAARQDSTGSRSAVLDRVVSSYTPRLGVLVRAQRMVTGPREPSVLLVAMPNTPYLPGGAPLPYVTKEVEFVAEAFPGRHTVRTGRDATRKVVLTDMATHAYAHFACHGAIDQRTPGESGLCLADGRLSVEELARRDLPLDALQFAFLSACHTGAASATLLDEAITVGSAMQLAGFRHVIATLWAINDRRSAEIARDVYEAMKNDQGRTQVNGREIANALHVAVRKQRDAGRPAREWAAFTHTGT